MNITNAREGLVGAINSRSRLNYQDNASVQTGDDIFVYGRRWDRGKRVEWSVKGVYRKNNKPEFGENIQEEKGSKQLILRGTIKEGLFRHYFSDVEVVQRSAIDKCKEDIKYKVVQLWRIGWGENYVLNNEAVNINNHNNNKDNLEEICEDHLKITTVRSKTKAMHFASASLSKDYSFKLGIKWKSWHSYMDSTERLYSLTHEIVHSKHPHHKESFFKSHAEFISNIIEDEDKKDQVESLFEGDINWNCLKTKVMHGVRRQSDDIDDSQFENKLEACKSLINEIEEIIEYKYKIGKVLYLYPPDHIKPRWVTEYKTTDKYDKYPSEEKIHPNLEKYQFQILQQQRIIQMNNYINYCSQ